jgi:hypothetical protein
MSLRGSVSDARRRPAGPPGLWAERRLEAAGECAAISVTWGADTVIWMLQSFTCVPPVDALI